MENIYFNKELLSEIPLQSTCQCILAWYCYISDQKKCPMTSDIQHNMTHRHDETIKELTKLKIDRKDLRIIKNMYWEQTAAMRVGEISAFQKIKRGVRQGCVLSPDLFSLYSEIIMRNIEGQPGIRVGGHNINNLDMLTTLFLSQKMKKTYNIS